MAVYEPRGTIVYPTEYDKLVAVIDENERLRQQVQELEKQLGECQVGYETGTRAIEELAASEAREAKLREAINIACTSSALADNTGIQIVLNRLHNVLALPKDDTALNECKRDALKAMVAAHSALQDLYYREDMLTEATPPWVYDMVGHINRLRAELAGA